MILSNIVGEQLDRAFTGRARKWVSLVIAILESFWFGGYHYGFNSLMPAYKDLGVYNSPNESKLFGYANIVWVLAYCIFGTLTGIMMDKVGLRALKLLSTGLFFVGTLMFAFLKQHTAGMLFPAGIFVAVGSTASLLCDMQITLMFPKIRGLTVALLTGAFDSSMVLTFIISHTAPTISIQTSFLIVACVALVYGLLVASFILTQYAPDMESAGSTDADVELLKEEIVDNHLDENVQETNEASTIAGYIDQRYPTLGSCFRSWPFCLITLWFMIGILRFSYFLGQLGGELACAFPGQETLQNQLLQASSAVSMCGFFAAPLSGILMDYSRKISAKRIKRRSDNSSSSQLYWIHMWGMAPALLTQVVFALILSCVIFIRQVWAFYLSFICFVMLRSLLFSSAITFVMISFPLRYFGTVYGVVTMIGGLFNMLQYALFEAPLEAGNGICVVFVCLSFIAPIVLFIKGR